MTVQTKTPPVSFAEAFVGLQSAIKPAVKDAENEAFKRGGKASRYADLTAVWEAIKVPLKDNGFAIIQMPQFEGETMFLETIILHCSGEKMTGRYPLRPARPDPQGFGSAITYARRYALCAMLGVVADEDDDGNAASGVNSKAAPASTPIPAPKRQYEDEDGQMQNWIDQQKTYLTNCETLEDVQEWAEKREDAMKKLHSKSLASWGQLIAFKEARIREITKGASK